VVAIGTKLALTACPALAKSADADEAETEPPRFVPIRHSNDLMSLGGASMLCR